MALCKENVSFDGIEIAGIEIPSQEQNRKKKVLNWCLGKTNGKQQGEGQDGLLGVMQKMPGVRTTGWGEDGAFSGSSLFSQPPPPLKWLARHFASRSGAEQAGQPKALEGEAWGEEEPEDGPDSVVAGDSSRRPFGTRGGVKTNLVSCASSNCRKQASFSDPAGGG